jgi:nucleotide-binding universal stress UspA family protein
MKILWAIDCFGGSFAAIKAGARFLNQLASNATSPLQVYPVSIMGPLEFQWFIDAGIKESPQHYLEKIVRKFKIAGLQYPKVISDSGFSLSASAKSLDAFGKKHQCEFILCMTQSRSGLKNAILGSFAEALVSRSKTSLFLVHPKGSSKIQFRKSLFSTDLSPQSRSAFKKFVSFASDWRSSVTVLHCAFQQSDWATALAMVESFQYLSGLPMNTKEASLKKDQTWFEEGARRQGVKAKFVVSRQYQQVADEILKTASRQGAGYLVMATHSGPISSMILGSTAKKVLRLSTRPVLVIK